MRTRWIRTFASMSAIILFALMGLSISPVSSQESTNGQAELHPIYLDLKPGSPIDQGRLVNVEIGLENTGNATANEFKVEFFIRSKSENSNGSWTSFGVDNIDGLASQEQEKKASATLNTSLGMFIPDPNQYEIRVVVDSNDQIPEQDEANNEIITSIIVQDSKLGLPDLRAVMMMFDPPSPVEEGTSTEVTGMVRNDGDANAPAFAVQFTYCRVAGTLDLSTCATPYEEIETVTEPFLGGLTHNGELAARAPLPELTPGTYLIRMAVDPSDDEHHPGGTIEEQDEANNELIVPFTVQGPEFHVTGIAIEPILPRVGDTVTVSATVLNSGQEKAADVEVSFFVNGRQFSTKDVSIAGAQSEVVRGTLNTTTLGLEAGKHTIRVIVDPMNLVSERDETNNETRTAMTLLVEIPKLPELRPKGLELTPSSPIQLGLNSNLKIDLEVLNTGPGAAEDVEVEFSYRSSGNLRWIPIQCQNNNCVIDSLAPGPDGLKSLTADLLLFGITPGSYEIRAVVDPDNNINELDEFNNELISAFTLQANRKCDLTIDPASVEISPSLFVKRGANVTITANILNIGEADCDPFVVALSFVNLQGVDQIPGTESVVDSVFVGDGLGLGGELEVEFEVDTTQFPPGPRNLIIEVDSQEQVMELDEFNNRTDALGFIPVLFIQGPDLTGVLELVEPVSSAVKPMIDAGTEVEVAATIFNGGAEAAGQFDVEFCYELLGDDGLPSGGCIQFGDAQTFPGLGMNANVTATAVLDTSTLASGSYNLKVVIDPVESGFPRGRVEEQAEFNNEAIRTIEIVGGNGNNSNAKSGIDILVGNIDVNPPLAALGQRVDVKATIKNNGTNDAGPFRVVFFYKRVGQSQMFSFHQVQMTGLPAGNTIWLQGSLLTSLLGTGDFEIIVIADFNNDIPENNEVNNRNTATLSVN